MKAVILKTKRLILRPVRLSDSGTIFRRYASDSRVPKYMSWTVNKSENETRRFLRQIISSAKKGVVVPWIITNRTDNSALGMITLHIDSRPGLCHMASLGFVIARSEWGNGYMTEAVRKVSSYALSHRGMFRVWAYCDVDNKASARVMKKSGMSKEGILRKFCLHPNISRVPRDVYCYARTK